MAKRPQTQGRKADYTPRLREIISLHERGRVLSPLGRAYLLENLSEEVAVLVDDGAKLHVDAPEEYFLDEDE